MKRETGIGMAPDTITGQAREREYNQYAFMHPEIPSPAPNASPREIALWQARQPTTTAVVTVKTIDPEVKFDLGKEYVLSILAPEDLSE